MKRLNLSINGLKTEHAYQKTVMEIFRRMFRHELNYIRKICVCKIMQICHPVTQGNGVSVLPVAPYLDRLLKKKNNAKRWGKSGTKGIKNKKEVVVLATTP